MKIQLYTILVLLLLASCRPAKKVQRIETSISKKDTSQTVIIQPNEKVDSNAVVKNILHNVGQNKIDFNTFSAKIKVEYEGKNGSDQATANIRIQKDSLIWVSLTGLLGIEGYRLLADKDSVRLMNKLNKTVQYRSISYLQELADIPLDFYSLQDLIMGNPVFLDSNIVSYRSNGKELLVMVTGKLFKNLVTFDTADYRIVHSKLDDVNTMRNRTCDITYNEFEKVNDFLFSKQRRISVAEKSKLDIDLNFKQYEFDKALSFPFNIPKNYKTK
ncbi:DUF4292 domain-containing protein [Foetidibacter luteolus]|uniref:DUF4292 domain-containing protein n=1 Tax=Foetidibacter luteolus TaxID=2608880 RepID=UPI00129B6948|nr:DUF4292 domain-containing protein [Foetidibacter luteolus]